jgi:hypothetical protein
VRFTDRVLSFPGLFSPDMLFPDGLAGSTTPNPTLLYATATGDPGDVGYFPMNAVRWRTPPRDLAALVTAAGPKHFRAELFHFGEKPRRLPAELYLLQPGSYTLTLDVSGSREVRQDLRVVGRRTEISIELPPQRPAVLEIRGTQNR